jgi:hypothetical protein
MKSPRFDIRAAKLRKIFTPANLERAWKDKVRVAMRQQLLADGVENFDFHVFRSIECKKLSQLILNGDYVPQRPQRILVEKSKGLCRQLVIPSVQDAIILQCLSDALYDDIRNSAPTAKSFYQPQQQRFSSRKDGYGTLGAWLNYQKGLFAFSKTRRFVAVTDIANYYDSISYAHLRNVISGLAGVEECVLDMLIFILSDLLWQPDYTPRIEIGLPQMNLDAPRLLAHCFLYELDAYLDSNPHRDFVRYMDDIDIGVDSIIDAKQALRSVDLVLQAKQVRLNSGKTQILTNGEALRHFRVFENYRIDSVKARIDTKSKSGVSVQRERIHVQARIAKGLINKAFDKGSGEKILKRWINLAATVDGRISGANLSQIIKLRPSMRETVYSFIRARPLTGMRAKILADCARSGLFVDDAAMVDLANHLVETRVMRRHDIHDHLQTVIDSADPKTYYGFYCRVWLQSKYSSLEALLDTLSNNGKAWIAHDRLGRLVGSLAPLFRRDPLETDYKSLLASTLNAGVRETYKFHHRLATDADVFKAMFDSLRNPNPSRGTGITHAKFLCLLSALENPSSPVQVATLVANNSTAFGDIYYRAIKRRLRL